jgi:hypothetical protein
MVTTDVPPPPSTTVTTTTPPATTTTLARLPETLPLVADEWEWKELLRADIPSEVRFDGDYLAYTFGWGNPLVVTRDASNVLEHRPLDESEWIIQDVELGNHWLAVVDNTEFEEPNLARLVVYDLRNGDVVFEELNEASDGRLSLPAISISGTYMAIAPRLEETACVRILDLRSGRQVDEVCGESSVFHVELDANAIAFETFTPDCQRAWIGTLYGMDHNLEERFNRECWSNGPASSGEFSVWFENPPEQMGIDTMIGLSRDGELVGLGKGDNGTLEICWNRAFWLSGDNDVRMWDGGEQVYTIYEAGDDRAYELGCVGPWVTFRTMDAIYTVNHLTQSAVDACDVVESADATQEEALTAALENYVGDRFDEMPEDLEVGVGGVVGQDGWWVGHGGFSSHLESAVFVWGPDGEVGLAWSGFADSEYEIREYMLSILPEVPRAILGCVNVDGFYSG